MPFAKDIYAEGGLIFPCVRVQRDRRHVEDVIRTCRRRIRVPDQWYGDFLATLGAARVGEAGLKELCARYGAESIKAFVREWFDYSERKMAHAISGMPAGTAVGTGTHDPLGDVLPDGIPLTVKVTVDPEAGQVEIDLTDNIDCVPADGSRSSCGRTASSASRGSRRPARSPRRTSATDSSSRRRRRSPTRGPATASPRGRPGSAPGSPSSRASTVVAEASRT
jgi:N-methylhydantoinase B